MALRVLRGCLGFASLGFSLELWSTCWDHQTELSPEGPRPGSQVGLSGRLQGRVRG